MLETLRCPGCDADLALSAMSDGEAVQCPRCQRVFEPSKNTGSAVRAGAPLAVGAASSIAEDHELFEPTPRLVPCKGLRGNWVAVLAMLMLAGDAAIFAFQAYTEYEFAKLQAQEMQLRALLADPDAADDAVVVLEDEVAEQRDRWLRLQRQAEAWVQDASWLSIFPFALWLYLTACNARLLQAARFSCSPAWVVGVLWVPLYNLVFLYQNLQEIWRASDPLATETPVSWRKVPPSLLIRLWALSLLCLPLLVFVVFEADRASLKNGVVVAVASLAANVIVVAAFLLMIAIICSITLRQRQRYIRLYEDPP